MRKVPRDSPRRRLAGVTGPENQDTSHRRVAPRFGPTLRRDGQAAREPHRGDKREREDDFDAKHGPRHTLRMLVDVRQIEVRQSIDWRQHRPDVNVGDAKDEGPDDDARENGFDFGQTGVSQNSAIEVQNREEDEPYDAE